MRHVMIYLTFAVAGLGLLLLFVGLMAAVSSVFESLRTRQTAGLVVIPCAEAAHDRHPAGTRVAVRGRTAPAWSGLLRAPVSGELCVWWRVQVHRIDDIEDGTRRVPLLKPAATVPFLVTDPSGSVCVDGVVAEGEMRRDRWLSGPLLDVTTHRRSLGRSLTGLETLVEMGAVDPRTLRPTRATRCFEVHETVLRAGVAATVVGHVARRDGVVVLGRRKARLAFARSEPLEEIVSTTEADRRVAVAAMAFLLISGSVFTVLGVGGALLIGPG
jgi:hypothetical protein